MTAAAVATGALLVLIAATTVLGGVLIFGRFIRRAREARRTRLAAPARRLLLAVTAGDDDPVLADSLVELDAENWRAVEPTAVGLLGKLRGEAHAALVEILVRRGVADRAVRDLRHRRPVRRAAAAEVLGHVGRRETAPAIAALLTDADSDVRAVAARALGRIGDPVSAVPLLRSLSGRRSVPPQPVAQALMRLGSAAQPALETALYQADELVRATAIEVLGLVGAISATGLVEYTLRADPSVEVRVRAAGALGRLGTRSALAPLLSAVEPVRPAALRAAATRALGDIGSVAATSALAVLLGDPQHAVAHNAAYALLRLGRAGRTVLNEALGAAEQTRRQTGEQTGEQTGDSRAEAARVRAAGYAREALAVAELQEHRRAPAVPVLRPAANAVGTAADGAAVSPTNGAAAAAGEQTSDIAGPDTARHDTAGPDTVGHDTVGHDTVGHDTAGHDTARHDAAGHDTARHDTAGSAVGG